MKLIGKNFAKNADGIVCTTLHLTDNFEPYYSNPEAGRGCEGQKVCSVYAGSYDCSALKVGTEIEIFYDKAVTTSRGTFQQVKKIEIIEPKAR